MSGCSSAAWLFLRNRDCETDVLGFIPHDDQVTTLSSRNVSRDRQSETGPVWLGRIERFKDSGQHFGRNRLTRVFDLEFHSLGRWTATANCNLSTDGRGIDRVEEQVHQRAL